MKAPFLKKGFVKVGCERIDFGMQFSIKKISILMMCSMLLIAGKSASFANSQYETITYEKAVELALKNSTEVRRSIFDIDKAKNQKNEFENNFDYSDIENLPAQSIFQINLTEKSLRVQQKLNERKLEYNKATLPVRILSIFNDIDKANQDKELLLIKKENISKNIDIAYAKLSNGAASKYDVDKNLRDLENINKQISDMDIKIESNHNELKKIMEIGPTRKIKTKPIEVDYKPLKESEFLIDHHIGKAVAVDINIYAKELQKDIETVNQTYYMFALTPTDKFDPYAESYKIQSSEKSIKNIEIEQLKRDISSAVNQKANTLMSLKNSIDSTVLKKDQLMRDKTILEKLFAQGMITKQQINDLDTGIKEIDLVISQLKRQYEFLKIVYSNPFTVGS